MLNLFLLFLLCFIYVKHPEFFFSLCEEGERRGEEREEEEEKDYFENYLEKYNALVRDDKEDDEKLEGLEKNILMETTPLGNVVMFYSNKTKSFIYYSDSIIPYRFLEVVSRKYVVTFNCANIYIDMKDVLKNAGEERKERKEKEEMGERKERKEREMGERKEKKEEKEETTGGTEKKSVFAKFKNYNNDSKSASQVPPKSSVSQKIVDTGNEKVLLKGCVNRYTYQGKMSNFSFLKKTDNKLVNKRLRLTFADFKKISHQDNL